MKVLLQDVRSKLFYRGGDVWTSNRDEAFDLQYSAGDRDFIEKVDLPDVEIIIDTTYCKPISSGPLSRTYFRGF